MTYYGLDLSASCTGFARISERGYITCAVKPPNGLVGAARLAWIYAHLRELLSPAPGGAVCALENYAMKVRGRVTTLAEVGGIARLALHQAGIPVLLVSPTTLKLWATGNGHAEKEDMRRGMIFSAMPLTSNETHDEVDALALAHLARARWENRVPPDKNRARSLFVPKWETSRGAQGNLPRPARKRPEK